MTLNGREPVVELAGVSVWTPERHLILDNIDWTIRRGEQWALLGPNGSGKTTLLSIISAWRHPSAGRAKVLGAEFGRADLLALRTKIGLVDPTQRTLDWLTGEEIVLTGATGTIRPLWNRYGPVEREQARTLLETVGCGDLADREIRHCSQGERQRIRIARAMMTQPELLILDEPAVGLDLPAREAMLAALRTLASDDPSLTMILVTHHLEELPDTISDAMLLARGRVVAAGKPEQTLTANLVSECFGLPVRVSQVDGRWAARAVPGWERGTHE
jgi:iron complex transport system ATP-binding protein